MVGSSAYDLYRRFFNNTYKIVGFTAKLFHNQFQKWKMETYVEAYLLKIEWIGNKVWNKWFLFLFAGQQDGTTWRGRVKDFVNEIWWNLVYMKLKALSMHLMLYFVVRSLSIFMKLFQVSYRRNDIIGNVL